MVNNDQKIFSPQDRLGAESEYLLKNLLSGFLNRWEAEGPKGPCHLHTYPISKLDQLSNNRKVREQKSILRELDRWRKVVAGRPNTLDLFWEGDVLCWVERVTVGAPLSSLHSSLTLYEGVSLIEECLCLLELLHSERDFQIGDPLLHLNITPQNIWREEEGALLLMHPSCPTLVELSVQKNLSDDEALSGEVAPELLRGRYGMSTDLYALGMSALSAMTGMSVARVDDRLQAERLFSHDLDCPKPVAEFLKQLTAFRASARYQSAREALLALQALPALEPLEPQLREQTADKDEEIISTSTGPKLLESELEDDDSTDDSPQFYTLADHRELGSIATEQLGYDHHLDSKDSVVVDVVVEDRQRQKVFIGIALAIFSSLLWVWFHHESSVSNSTVSQMSQADLGVKGLKLPLVQPQRGIAQRDTEQLFRGEVTSSPIPQWIKMPEGLVNVGSPVDEGYESERPLHIVKVTAFKVSKTEVTVLQYAQCVAQGVCSTEGLKSSDWGDDRLCNWDQVGRSDHPLNCVSWYQARTYARWVGGRLLSETEWSYVAQGASNIRKIYPWGPEPASCQYAMIADFVRGSGCGEEHTAPVCRYLRGNSPQGVCDLVGNVWEWVMDEWHDNYEGAPLNSIPWISAEGEMWNESDRVYRGGGAFDETDLPRIARRNHRTPNARLFNLGFRIAKNVNDRSKADRSPSPTPRLKERPDSTP
jgi:formylglycine-generating enzyme